MSADSHFICQTCGHNSSQHRNEWNPFLGQRNTSCRATTLAIEGRDQCRCPKFQGAESA